jgi:hypothetical protein
VPEWPKGHASKACDVQASVGSNPTSSAKNIVVTAPASAPFRIRTRIRTAPFRIRTRTVPHPQRTRIRTRIRTVLGRKTVVLRSETYLRRKNYREGGRWGGGMISSRVQRWALPSQ